MEEKGIAEMDRRRANVRESVAELKQLEERGLWDGDIDGIDKDTVLQAEAIYQFGMGNYRALQRALMDAGKIPRYGPGSPFIAEKDMDDAWHYLRGVLGRLETAGVL